MGLLDQLSAGLLGGDSPSADLGLSLLSSAGPSPVKLPFGYVVGQGVNNARQQAMAAQELKRRAMDLQMQQFQLQQFQQNYPYWQSYLQSRLGGAPVQAAVNSSPPPGGQAAGGGGGGGPGGAAPQQAPAQAAPQAQPSSPNAPGGNGWQDLNLGLVGSVMGMPGAKELGDIGKTELQYSPEVATQLEFAKGQVAQGLALMKSGDPNLQQAGYFMYLKGAGLLHVADRTGNVTTFGGVDPSKLGIGSLNPAEGLEMQNGVQSAIPGAAAARGEIAAGEAGGKALYEPMTVTDAQGNTYTVPRAVLGGYHAPAARPPSPTPTIPPAPAANSVPPPAASATPAAPGLPSGLGPGVAALVKGKADQALEINKEFQNKAEAGNAMLTQTATLRDAANDFTPGQFANSRMKLLNYLNSSGLITPEQAKSLGSAQEGQKIAIQLQAAATKQLGSREAAQIFTIMGKSLPNLELSQNGLEKVSAYMEGISRYDIARAQAVQQLMKSGNIDGVNGVRDDYIKNSNPLYFIVASAKPEIQRELINSMGAKAAPFLKQWNAAATAGYAPRPGQYWGN